jgi:transcriptional regulator with XRE-family HTH domain
MTLFGDEQLASKQACAAAIGYKTRCDHRGVFISVTGKEMTDQVGQETGVSATTLTRMAQGRRPDAGSLAALSAWAGLNPADYVNLRERSATAEPLARISSLLRSDPRLKPEAAVALEAMLQSAYERLKTSGAGGWRGRARQAAEKRPPLNA